LAFRFADDDVGAVYPDNLEMKSVGRSVPDRRQKGAVQAITCDVIAAPHDPSDIETVAVRDCLPRDKTLENTTMTQALNASHTSVNGGMETLAKEPSARKQSGPTRGGSRPNHPGASELLRGVSQQKVGIHCRRVLKQWFASVIPLPIKSVE
jgi:hypothetical protein